MRLQRWGRDGKVASVLRRQLGGATLGEAHQVRTLENVRWSDRWVGMWNAFAT
jgi:hypothetical protein